MNTERNNYLIAGAALSGFAALLHLGCVVFGAPWYRFLGAGERVARMDLAGHWLPTAMALAMACLLSVWALYALSGAGVIRKLPYVRLALCFITAIYFLRGLAFPPLILVFPDNSTAFWLASSAICVLFGVVHLLGLKQAWWKL
ncbi:hypothetical protein [Pseudoduganella namucuonensis]|uniref:DUF3995 domain-containing protein n=1 Tax=Pseudoduganella namucuonensis TaxID=1035707 RepID=A0A1I7IA19_9BURK|nr:hypothetical protein [Pseudoduganella namucuonensis]SFU69833.1 hypothetical protein SAMN05216552_1007222 [Pseudoduganella namucuonensis]